MRKRLTLSEIEPYHEVVDPRALEHVDVRDVAVDFYGDDVVRVGHRLEGAYTRPLFGST